MWQSITYILHPLGKSANMTFHSKCAILDVHKGNVWSGHLNKKLLTFTQTGQLFWNMKLGLSCFIEPHRKKIFFQWVKMFVCTAIHTPARAFGCVAHSQVYAHPVASRAMVVLNAQDFILKGGIHSIFCLSGQVLPLELSFNFLHVPLDNIGIKPDIGHSFCCFSNNFIFLFDSFVLLFC